MPPRPERPIRAVIFDHDGTLVDSEPHHLAAWQELLAPYNATLSTEEYQRHLSGRPSLASAQWLTERFDLPLAAEALFQQKHRALCAWLEHQAYPLMPGALPLLQALLETGTPLAVASGASSSEVQSSLERHNLHPFFPVVVTRDQVTHNKPAPDVYLLAAQQLGIAPEDCLAIEDSDSGQRAALAAGMSCLRLDTHTELDAPSRSHTLPDLLHVRLWLAEQEPLSS